MRLLPCWHEHVAPAVRSGKRVLIVAHGNSLRALVKHLDGVSDVDIAGLDIPTGVPLVYELGEDLKPVRSTYLGERDRVHESTPPRGDITKSQRRNEDGNERS